MAGFPHRRLRSPRKPSQPKPLSNGKNPGDPRRRPDEHGDPSLSRLKRKEDDGAPMQIVGNFHSADHKGVQHSNESCMAYKTIGRKCQCRHYRLRPCKLCGS